MRLFTLWERPADDPDEVAMPWVVDAVDEYTIDNNGDVPESYTKKRLEPNVRELIIDIPEDAVRKLFHAPVVKASVADDGWPDPRVLECDPPHGCLDGNCSMHDKERK